jgi:hypothetical protein
VGASQLSLFDLVLIPSKSFIRALRELRNPVSAHSNHPNGVQWTDACLTTVVEFASNHEIVGHVRTDDFHQEGETGPSQREIKDVVCQI